MQESVLEKKEKKLKWDDPEYVRRHRHNYYLKNLDRWKEYGRNRNKEGQNLWRRNHRERLRKYEIIEARKYRVKYPEKHRAKSLLNRAVNRGDMKKPMRCTLCNKIPIQRSDGRSGLQGHHHNGYENPLDVIWLCVKCHVDLHNRKLGGRENEQA